METITLEVILELEQITRGPADDHPVTIEAFRTELEGLVWNMAGVNYRINILDMTEG